MLPMSPRKSPLPNGISIGSAVFAGPKVVTNTQTDTQRERERDKEPSVAVARHYTVSAGGAG